MGKRSKIVFILISFVAAGCAYTTKSVLPDNIQNVAVSVFKNDTFEYGLEERLTDKVIQEFISHGRLKVTNIDNADALIKGKIVAYNLLTTSTDEYNNPIEKELSILIEISFWEKDGKEPLWIEKGIRENITYFTTLRSGQIVMTESEAKENVLSKLARSVVRRVIIGWY
ncbi:MAG: LPS assembly lipoprotein LptE [bacterium]|nr:LPS assembly lipoprotein LptE [bacterium]